MDTLADRVKAARVARGWTQADLAREAEVKPQSIQQLEAGAVQNPRYLVRLAEALGVELRWLHRGDILDQNTIKWKEGDDISKALEDMEFSSSYRRNTTFIAPAYEEEDPVQKIGEEKYSKIPVYNFRTSRDFGLESFNSAPDYSFLFPLNWISQMSSNPLVSFVIMKFTDNSMSGYTGSHVMFDCSQNSIEDSGWYLVRPKSSGKILVRYSHSPSDMFYASISNSPAEKPESASLSELSVIARAIWSDKLL